MILLLYGLILFLFFAILASMTVSLFLIHQRLGDIASELRASRQWKAR
jgi:hypothetical protein